MRIDALGLWIGLCLVSCGSATNASPGVSAPPPPGAPAPPPGVAAAPPPAPATTAEAAPAPPAPKPNAEDAPPTAADYAQAEEKAKEENARFTPEVREKAKALAEAKYKSLHDGLDALLKSPTRKPGNPERDVYRHPLETLSFIGITPKMTVIEYGPGEGWYTELLAPLLAKSGKLVVTTPDPKGPETDRGTLAARRLDLFLGKSPELFGKVERVVVNGKSPALPEDGTVEAVLLFRGLHGMVRQGTTEGWLAAFHKALKPRGILGVEQHRAPPGANPEESAKQGYLPEAWVVAEIEKAGFKLEGKSEINANPKDTKDYPEGVWTLPPTLRMKDKDRDKYLAIGESDRMTLKFVKTAR